MELKYIIMAIVLVVIIYFIINKLLTDKAVASSEEMFKSVQANEGLNSLKTKIREGVISDFGYSFWIYVSEWNNDKEKSIIKHSVLDAPNCNRVVKLSQSLNNLVVHIPHESTGSGGYDCMANTSKIEVDNIPLQRWVHIVVTAHNRSLDVYINGKLVKTKIMAGVPKANENGAKLDVCKGDTFEGKLSRFSYHEKALSPRDVRKIYVKGPEPSGLLGGLFGKYKMKLLFLKGSDKVTEFSV